ncbi:MAG: SAM-dependent methyltransferase [Saprospiraceae bacterium]
MKEGKIHLIPVPLSDGNIDQLSVSSVQKAREIAYFLAEKSKSARQFIKLIQHPLKQAEIEVREMEEGISKEDMEWVTELCRKGIQVAIVSEAGVPCVADPGNKIVLYAHQNKIEVLSYAGPNSMIMALMASGLNGQQFQFHGYLPRKKEELKEKFIQLGKSCQQNISSQIFMETPYRNIQIMQMAIAVLPSNLFLSVSLSLGTKDQKSITLIIKDWKNQNLDFIKDKPAVYVIGKG